MDVEKSMPCLMTAERAVRTTVKAMVSAALINAFLMISLVTASVARRIPFSFTCLFPG